ncbi:zinc-binding alcohol dehydrogenase family protein [Streptomyces olivochromogenes]|uniref:zinc-binding alcohol dehydrogenase family protein n=1 Tax=Streptomyces olivochromogenes TaxID=1963 RepID=UPI001F1B6E4B|nr:zinc-binding alcohol dehydrogenase family protein [Streptomyces olivochromogenes]MCF3131697.1 zinc-binding dehydrogenase [Streptomyces olivochromogenes]
MITTEAWVLHAGPAGAESGNPVPGKLVREEFSFPDIGEDEVLVEPLYGSWEANMSHALERAPVDVCRQRGEDRMVIGNFGVVRVVRPGKRVTRVKEGDLCLMQAFARTDDHGYVKLVHAYDAPGTIGVLARRTKICERLLLPLPDDTRYSLQQWAASYGRYWTAWDNWKVAYACWRSQVRVSPADMDPPPLAFGWGGGVAVAELELAQRAGFRAAMASGNPQRLAEIEAKGMTPVDRRLFPDLDHDEDRMAADPDYRRRYRQSERTFLKIVNELSGRRGAAVVIDNIGKPVHRATLRALGRQGVLATVGWKHGMRLENVRANECIKRHIHVHTHACCFYDIEEILEFQESSGWMLELGDQRVYGFDEIPLLARDYAEGNLDSYFPLFRINQD